MMKLNDHRSENINYKKRYVLIFDERCSLSRESDRSFNIDLGFYIW